jgi:hypothetical protein
MKNSKNILFFFVLVASLAGCQLLKQPSLAKRCAEAYPCKDSTYQVVVERHDTIVEPYWDTLTQVVTQYDTLHHVFSVKRDTTYLKKYVTRIVVRHDTIQHIARLETAKLADVTEQKDSLKAHLDRVESAYKNLKAKGTGAIWGVLIAVFALIGFLMNKKKQA